MIIKFRATLNGVGAINRDDVMHANCAHHPKQPTLIFTKNISSTNSVGLLSLFIPSHSLYFPLTYTHWSPIKTRKIIFIYLYFSLSPYYI